MRAHFRCYSSAGWTLRVRLAGLKAYPALLKISLVSLLDVQIRRCPGAVLAEVVGVAIDRMAGPVETQRFLLVIELFNLGPWRHGWKLRVAWCAAEPFLAAAKQIRLAEILVALRPRTVLARGVDRRKQLRPDCS